MFNIYGDATTVQNNEDTKISEEQEVKATFLTSKEAKKELKKFIKIVIT